MKILVEIEIDEGNSVINSVKVNGLDATYHNKQFDASWYTIYKQTVQNDEEGCKWEIQLCQQWY